ncbi:MAG: ATP-binding protein [Lentimicrobiaceae bacterium]|nr:ATP-binding protein [Lentimicrobiaceae bacterium]
MYKRTSYIAKIEKALQAVPIVVLIGARQVGKTSIMQSIDFQKKVVSLNGQDVETAALFDKPSTIENYLKVYLNEELDGSLLIDEFQYIDGISTLLKLLTDKNNQLKILCSGSSSLDILQKVEESLAGRARIIEVLSLSFEEYLQFSDPNLHQLYLSLNENTASSALTAPIEQLFAEFLIFGGLPRAALVKSYPEKIEILNDIYQTYLLKDIRNYIANEQVVGFNKLIQLLALQIGNLLNINKLSRESGLTYKTCENFLFLLEQMYIIKMISPFQGNQRKAITKMQKLYFCDTGLRNRLANNFNSISLRNDNGAIFENAVFLELWKHKSNSTQIQFFRTTDGTEVDFIYNNLFSLKAIECKYKIFQKPVRLLALENFCAENNIQEKYVINQNLNSKVTETHFLQGFLVEKLKEKLH